MVLGLCPAVEALQGAGTGYFPDDQKGRLMKV